MAANPRIAVIGVGGNSLIVSRDKQSIPDQAIAAEATCHHIAELVARGWHIIVTHGSGPQVGFILRRSELASDEVAPVPMDYADADIQGAVGYMFQRALNNEYRRRGMDRRAVAVVTQVLVDRDDPAFDDPTKPIGPSLDEATAKRRVANRGWDIREQTAGEWRRVVASPHPREILELDQIKLLAENGYTVIACGGGGIPVIEGEDGDIHGIEAVVDKDLASSLLARGVGATCLLLSTNVERVALDFDTPNARWIDRFTVADARANLIAGQFGAGSMGPKIEAAIAFLEGGGDRAVITDPDHMVAAIDGAAGTTITL